MIFRGVFDNLMESSGGRFHEIIPSSSDSVLNIERNSTIYARANHVFKGRNNDELSFRKGDIITVTQQLEGGWWEGTLHSYTGWFPSNYVTIISESERFLRSRSNGPSILNGDEASSGPANESPLFSSGTSRQAYREQVMRSFLEAEFKYIDNITKFNDDTLAKIKDSKKISENDFEVLVGNLQLLIAHQSELLSNMKGAVEKDATNARIGGLLLRAAPNLRHLLRLYCQNHPKAVDLILRKKNVFDDLLNEIEYPLKDLISGLSRPFRHLETYPSMLNELERGMHEAHPDRGDTQRAAAVFRDIANCCGILRKQKEMQLELFSSGSIDGLPSEELKKLGEVLYMGIATVDDVKASTDEELSCDRCVILFSTTILILEITSNVNSYIMKKKISLDKLTLKKAENKTTLILCNADGSSEIAMNLLSNDELERWVEAFSCCTNLTGTDYRCDLISSFGPQKIDISNIHNMADISPLRKAEISQLPVAVKADNAKRNVLPPGLRFDHKLEMVLPEGISESENTKDPHSKRTKMYSGFCLRPFPAVRGNYAVDYSRKTNIKLRKEISQGDQEDAFLLSIVEGYSSATLPVKRIGNGTQSSSVHEYDAPQLIVAENEKMFVEEVVGDQVVVKEKSLVDTVYALRDQLNNVQKELIQLNKTIDREQKSRRRLEEMVRRLCQQLQLQHQQQQGQTVLTNITSKAPLSARD
ncbi:Rho guanine nucleotide exchange factor [Dirofilaria immitis]